MKELFNQLGSKGTNFLEMGVEEFSYVPLNGIVMSVEMALEDAINYVSKTTNALGRVSQTFTHGHYGEKSHEWKLVGYEKYLPDNLGNGSLVILYYRPIDEDFIRSTFSLEKESDAYDLVYNQGEDY